MTTGSYSIQDLLKIRNASIAEIGLDTVTEAIQRDLAVHNAQVLDLVAGLCEVSTDRQRRYGAVFQGDMTEVDEFGRAPTQKGATGSTVGFPLRLFQYAIGWTRKYLDMATPRDLALQSLAGQDAHLRAVSREIRKAFFFSANYTFRDFLVDQVDLSVKRLINADSSELPNGPNGETFDSSTHSHYNGSAALDAAAATACIDDLVEHGHSAYVVLAINKAQETTFRGLTGFTAYLDPRLIPAADTQHARETLDITRIDNRPIGVYGSAEVWVKTWVPANYICAYDPSDPNKPLVYRERRPGSGALVIAAEIADYPLQAQWMESEFGIGVWTRTNGVATRINNASYADPTIT